MIGLPLVFLGGLLGSAHCVGMCGGFALLIGSGARSTAANVARQLVVQLGANFHLLRPSAPRSDTRDLRLADDAPAVVHVQAVLAIAAGVLLVVQGLVAAGVAERGRRLDRGSCPVSPAASATAHCRCCRQHSGGGGCLATASLAAFLRSPGWGSVFLAGMLTGFLPCGLVYAYLALAASAADFVDGHDDHGRLRTGNGALMVATGSGASLLSLATRQRLYRLAAWCVVLTGLLSMARGASRSSTWRISGRRSCPMCP